MNLIIAIVPVLSLIVLMAFFKMSGDKSSIISLVVTMLIAFFGFHFPLDDLLFSFLYGAMKAVSPILIIILMAIFSYNVLLKTEKMEIIKQQFSSISTDKSIQVLLLTWGFGGLLEAMAGFGTAVAIPAAILISLGFKTNLFGNSQSDCQQCSHSFRRYWHTSTCTCQRNKPECTNIKHKCCPPTFSLDVFNSINITLSYKS